LSKNILEAFTTVLSAAMHASLSNSSQVAWPIIRGSHRRQDHERHAKANLICWEAQAMGEKLI